MTFVVALWDSLNVFSITCWEKTPGVRIAPIPDGWCRKRLTICRLSREDRAWCVVGVLLMHIKNKNKNKNKKAKRPWSPGSWKELLHLSIISAASRTQSKKRKLRLALMFLFNLSV